LKRVTVFAGVQGRKKAVHMDRFNFRKERKRNMFIIHSVVAVLASLTVTAQQPQPKTIPQQMERAIVSVLVGQQTMLEQK
jgi:hypothetical protein